MSDQTELLTVRAAELYYEDNKKHYEISALLGISRWKVGRLLTQAREREIVRIQIVHPRARLLALEKQLRERFGLEDAIVIPTSDGTDVFDRVTQAAADYLAALRPAPRTLGVSWGRTMSAVAHRLAPGWAKGVEVVQINGGLSLNHFTGTAASVATSIAHKASGQANLLESPVILERPETKRAIESDRSVASVLELAKTASVYLYSAGVADDSSVLVESGYLTQPEIAELVRNGAVGDVLGRFIGVEGDLVDPELDGRTTGISLDQLRCAEIAIFVVAGATKQSIARAVVSNRLCSVIVTDEGTARALLVE